MPAEKFSNVRLWLKADILMARNNVRYALNSGHSGALGARGPSTARKLPP